MYTRIDLANGLLRIQIEDQDEEVDQNIWKTVIQPGIQLLHAAGGGALCVPHLPGDLR